MIARRTIHIFLSLIFIVLILAGPFVFGDENPAMAKNIEFVNADLRDVFRSLAAAGKFNIIMEPRVHGNVTLALRYGVTVKDAVSVIAKTYGYSCRWLADSPTALVGSSKFIQMNFDHKISKTYPLKYASPKEIAESLEVVIPKSRIKADLQNNQVVVLANEIEIENITEIIGKLDREFQPIDLEVELVQVPAEIWNKLGITNNYQPPHMGVYALKKDQKKLVEDIALSGSVGLNFSGLDNHQLRIFLGDKVSLITTKKRKGDVNYQVEYVDAGTSLLMTPQMNSENQLTLMTKAAVTTIANKSQPGAKWVPWVVTRDFESTIRLEIGQTFILSGILQQNEYQMIKKSPYRFPELDKLFASQKPVEQTEGNSSSQLIALLTPRLADKMSPHEAQNPENIPKRDSEGSGDNGNSSSNGSNQAPDDKQLNPTASGSESKLPINEDKPEVKITPDTTKTNISEVEKQEGAPTSKEKGILNSQFVDIRYHVKKGDTLTSIVKKFATPMDLVTAKNNLNQLAVIKEDLVLVIPVPLERTYVLKPKETLWRIAKRYGTTLEVLKDLNGINDETKVKAGEIIVLPCVQTKIINPKF